MYACVALKDVVLGREPLSGGRVKNSGSGGRWKSRDVCIILSFRLRITAAAAFHNLRACMCVCCVCFKGVDAQEAS